MKQIFLNRKIQYLLLLIIPCITLAICLRWLVQDTLPDKNILASIQKPQAVATTHSVAYTNEGYVPDYLDILVGDTVIFNNLSTLPMWTASNPHPTHTDLNGFDSGKTYAPGETYKYTFNVSGSFGYHNHEKSNHRGLIRVTDKNHPLPNIDKTRASQEATLKKYKSLLEEHNSESVFTLLDAISSNANVSRDCHDMAHDLGHYAYELYGFSGAMTYGSPNRKAHPAVDDVCAGGYMHGILEELFLHQPKLASTPAFICNNVPNENKDSCFHGVGHGLMFVYKRNIAESLQGCRNISDTIFTRRCFEGVWMELFWGKTEHAGADSLGWNVEKPLQPCIEAKQDEKPGCYLYAHLGYLRTHTKDYEGAIALCTNSDLPNWDSLYCLRGVGITTMKSVTSKNLEKAEQYTYTLSEKQKFAYYEGVIGYALLSSVTKSELERVCKNLQTDSEVCLKVLEKTQ